jgi:hypothetical protein
MARARNIKPGFFKNEDLAEIGPLAMLLFEGLWCLADREGRLEDRPRRIKAETFPYFDVDVDALLNALQERRFVLRYEAAGERYIQVVNFTKHQTPHIKEAPSTIPAPDEHQTSTVLAPPDTGYRIPDSLIPDSGLSDCGVQGDSGADAPPKPKTKRATAMTDDWMPTEIDLAWAKGDGFPMSQVIGETEKFRDHFKATGKPMKDWDAAWKNWMRRSREFGPARASPNGSNGLKPEERRPAIPLFEGVERKQMSPEKLAQVRREVEARRAT